MRQPFRFIGWTTLWVASLMLAGLSAHRVVAQAEDGQWSAPVNLSHSGGAANPTLIADGSGRLHALWEDAYAGLMYARLDGDGWSEPASTQLDSLFGLPAIGPAAAGPGLSDWAAAVSPGSGVRLVAGGNGRVHAFWITARGSLYTSYAAAGDFANAAAWLPIRLLAADAVALDAVADTNGDLHLAYMVHGLSGNLPAGIYYQVSRSDGDVWAPRLTLYESPYLRGVAAGGAHLDIAAADTGQATNVYLAWDNRARRQALLARSTDSGQTWATPAVVDGPSTRAGQPFGLRVAAAGPQVLLTWQRGDAGTNCTQVYRNSGDGGSTFSDAEPLLDELGGCVQHLEPLAVGDDQLLAVADVQGQIYLAAWDGGRWSQPRSQAGAASFDDPEILETVTLGCRQVQPLDRELYVAGCDRGGGDIWLTHRPLGATDEWFAPQTSWSGPLEVAHTSQPVESLALAAEPDGRLHGFWAAEDASAGSAEPVIWHAGWDGTAWSTPAVVLRSPDGAAEQPAVAYSEAGQLLAAWTGGGVSAVYFSRADAGRAYSSQEWSPPIRVSGDDGPASSPSIQVGPDGTISIAYAVPINEGRGIYLAQSRDGGQTWAPALRVFDAAGAGWEVVDQPRLVRLGDGSLHVLWARLAPRGNELVSLNYARTTDGGQTWSAPEGVTGQPAAWSALIAGAGGQVHRVWLESPASARRLRHEYSGDGGLTWSRILGEPNLAAGSGLLALTEDRAGQVHLVQVVGADSGESQLNYWLWAGKGWAEGESLKLPPGTIQTQTPAALVVAPTGLLGVMYAGQLPASAASAAGYGVLFASRQLEVQPEATQSASTTDQLTPTSPALTATQPAQPAPSATAPVADTPNPAQLAGGAAADDPWSAPVVTAGIVGALVATVFAARVIGDRWRQYRK